MFGEEDIVFNRPHVASVCCLSPLGEVLAMKASVLISHNSKDFIRKVKLLDETWNLVRLTCEMKEENLNRRLENIDKFYYLTRPSRNAIMENKSAIEESKSSILEALNYARATIGDRSSPEKSLKRDTSTNSRLTNLKKESLLALQNGDGRLDEKVKLS